MSFHATYPFDLQALPVQGLTFKSREVFSLLLKARVELAELKGYCATLPNPMLLLSPAILQESLASSEIENINTTIVNVLQNQLFPENEQHTVDKEVLRYRDAMIWAFGNYEKLGLSSRLILGIEKSLFPKGPNEYRMLQNGIINSITKNLIYTPPVAANVQRLMGNLETFMNETDDMDPLIRTIISHYQFEAIHPFSDGNGRAGRILMVLQLVAYELLNLPILYISGYINTHKSEYYRLLLEVTSKASWEEYILFMLQGYYLQARETKEMLFKMKYKYYETKKQIKERHKKIYSADLVDALFTFPIITPAKLASEVSIHRTTASRYLKQLSHAGLLSENKVGTYKLYANKELMNLMNG